MIIMFSTIMIILTITANNYDDSGINNNSKKGNEKDDNGR